MKFANMSVVLLLCLVSACAKLGYKEDVKPLPNAQSLPVDVSYGDASLYGGPRKTHGKIAAVLPLSGKYAAAGLSMQKAMEIAALKSRDFVSVEFFDIGGDDKTRVMQDAVRSGADIILGPLFSDDVNHLREVNSRGIPVIAFTSDSDALGGGVLSLGVAPKQQAERIVRYAAAMGKRNMLIIAPDTKVGRILAANSRAAADMYGVDVVGLYYHDENEKPDKLRELARTWAFHKVRTEANTEAKGILSEVLAERGLSGDERASLEEQLKARTSNDSIGALPYDSILLLSGANDAKSLASFLRYYDVAAADVQFFGTAAWDAEGVRTDMILSGAAFPGLPMAAPDFIASYKAVAGTDPARAAGAGYDAVMIAVKVLKSDIPVKIALSDTDGWKGVDGIVRFRSNGEAERGLMIYRLNGTGRMSVSDLAPQSFMKPLYKLGGVPIYMGNRIDLPNLDIEPLDYLNVPARFAAKRRRAKSDADFTPGAAAQRIFYVDDAPSEKFVDDDFKFDAPEKVEQKLLDNVQITEKPKPAGKPKAAPKPAAKPAAAKPKPAPAKPAAKPAAKKPAADFMDVEPF
ncbi:MAG: penicillin-binding protein activator [Rickettsiales bacterium]|jgi:ABC-type branched-subunit amino acid transport system substrate-binding protein|nr:penicillin-binding protein activator [Rickettsiales bacterium]